MVRLAQIVLGVSEGVPLAESVPMAAAPPGAGPLPQNPWPWVHDGMALASCRRCHSCSYTCHSCSVGIYLVPPARYIAHGVSSEPMPALPLVSLPALPLALADRSNAVNGTNTAGAAVAGPAPAPAATSGGKRRLAVACVARTRLLRWRAVAQVVA